MKDNFSKQANLYAQYRPVYPKEFYDFILNNVANAHLAWDCATGNGQVAVELANYFSKVHATDISEMQISNAKKIENVIYKVEPAERTSFPENYFDLVVVAQALHWFNFDLFYNEIKRVIKPGGLFVAAAYDLCKTNDETDDVLMHFYKETMGPYWDEERKYIDEKYLTIPFPFSEIPSPKLFIETTWMLDEFIGFLNTWSAVQHYKNKNNQNPVDFVFDDFRKTWGKNPQKIFRFPMYIRACAIKNDAVS